LCTNVTSANALKSSPVNAKATSNCANSHWTRNSPNLKLFLTRWISLRWCPKQLPNYQRTLKSTKLRLKNNTLTIY
jgi:hypothetical protein